MSATELDRLLLQMWHAFLAQAPDARAIHPHLSRANPQLAHDHIALRTFDLAPVNLGRLAVPFVRAGYRARGEYFFPQKKLFAQHFEHPDPSQPKLFISELHVDQLSRPAQQLIRRLIAQIPDDRPARDGFCCSGRHWTLGAADYRQLLAESDYAAWLAALGYCPAHFAVLVNSLQSHASLEAIDAWLRQQGYPLNCAAGPVKGSPEEYLEQSATLASPVETLFSDGPACVPGSHYAFARRYPFPDGHLFQGFIAASADCIFESTDVTPPHQPCPPTRRL